MPTYNLKFPALPHFSAILYNHVSWKKYLKSPSWIFISISLSSYFNQAFVPRTLTTVMIILSNLVASFHSSFYCISYKHVSELTFSLLSASLLLASLKTYSACLPFILLFLLSFLHWLLQRLTLVNPLLSVAFNTIYIKTALKFTCPALPLSQTPKSCLSWRKEEQNGKEKNL